MSKIRSRLGSNYTIIKVNRSLLRLTSACVTVQLELRANVLYIAGKVPKIILFNYPLINSLQSNTLVG